MRIFLDANVLFSAAKSAGAIQYLLDRLLETGHECWADHLVLTEARRNLERKSSDGLAILDRFRERLKVAAAQAPDAELAASLPAAEKDRPVLAAAIRLGCDVLVTGDRTHFGALYGRSIGGVTIHSPRSLAEALLRPSRSGFR